VNKDVLVAIVKPILDKFLGGQGEESIPKFTLMGGIGNMVQVMQAVNTAQDHLRKGTLAETLVSNLSEDVLKDIEDAILAGGYMFADIKPDNTTPVEVPPVEPAAEVPPVEPQP